MHVKKTISIYCRLFGVFLLALLLVCPAFAQETSYRSSLFEKQNAVPFSTVERDENQLFSNAGELIPSFISDTLSWVQSTLQNVSTQSQQFYIGYSKEDLDLSPAETDAVIVEEKLKSSLKELKDSTRLDLVQVNIIAFPDMDNEVDAAIVQAGGILETKNKIGHVITAKIPENKLSQLALESKVKSIWPERYFHSNLDSSVSQIHASFLWNLGYQGTGIRIAVLDSGIDSNHPMLQGKVIGGASFTGEPLVDYTGHGTLVAGIIAGSQNGANTYNGVAPAASLMNVKVLDSGGTGAESWIISGINYAVDPDSNPSTTDGAHIINISFGGHYTDPNSPIVAAIEQAIAQGVTVVIASGNCGQGCPDPNCGGFIGIDTPAESPNAITVGAVDDLSMHACFSSGATIGNQIKPDVVAPGVDIISSYLYNTAVPFSGTSFAAPHVSGLVALVLQANPGISPANVKNLVEQTAVDLGAPGKDIQYGSGLVSGTGLVPSNVYNLLRYHLSQSNTLLNVNQSQSFTITSVSNDIVSIDAVISKPNHVQIPLTFSPSGNAFTASFSNTDQEGSYLVDVNITNLASAITSLNKTFYVRGPSTTGIILGQNLPVQASHGQMQTVQVQFQNTGAYNTEVLLELQEWKSDYFERIYFSPPTPVNANQTLSIPIQWVPQSSLGNKTIKLVATFDDNALEIDQNVLVVDADLPLINSISFPSSIPITQPLLVQLNVGDLTPVRATLHLSGASGSMDYNLFSSPLTSAGDFNQSLFVEIETTSSGGHSFWLEVCDGYNNCMNSTNYNFTVNPCSNPSALMMVSDSNSNSYDFLSPNYCLGFWKISPQLPSLSYLNHFPLVYWEAGENITHAPDANAAQLLIDYNGNLVLEGDNIAALHAGSDFSRNILHADLNQDLQFDANVNLPLISTFPVRFFDNLPNPIPFNYTHAVSPDSVSLIPDMNGIELAKWDNNGSAIVAYQNGLQRHLFMGFSTLRLSPVHRQTLLMNIFNWAYLNNGFDLVMESINRHPAPNTAPFYDGNALIINPLEHPTPFLRDLNQGQDFSLADIPFYRKTGYNIVRYRIKNNGTQNTPLFVATMQVQLDGNTIQTITQNIYAGTVATLDVNMFLPPGMHKIGALLNQPYVGNEINILNNTYVQEVWVAPTQPNLRVTEVKSHGDRNAMKIEFEAVNLGGTLASTAVLVSFEDFNAVVPLSLGAGRVWRKSIDTNRMRHNVDVNAFIDYNYSIVEYDETDNQLSKRAYFCSQSNVLIVDDDDAEPQVQLNPSSAKLFQSQLNELGYCNQTWKTSAQGLPSSSMLASFPAVIWSTGDYWGNAIDSNESELIQQYDYGIWLEGNDIGFENRDTNLLNEFMRVDYNREMVIPSGATQILLHPLLQVQGLQSIDLNLENSSFPDAFTPAAGAFNAFDWNDGGNAIVVYDHGGRHRLMMGFALDNIISPASLQALVSAGLSWITTTNNYAPSTPTYLTCNNASCENGAYTGYLTLACGGSIDPENNPIIYSLEVRLGDASPWIVFSDFPSSQSIGFNAGTISPAYNGIDLRCQARDSLENRSTYLMVDANMSVGT